jgi:hypothetical protein
MIAVFSPISQIRYANCKALKIQIKQKIAKLRSFANPTGPKSRLQFVTIPQARDARDLPKSGGCIINDSGLSTSSAIGA